MYSSICDELQLNTPFNPSNINGEFAVRRCLLESIYGGADYFVSEGVIHHGVSPDGQIKMQSRITFEGWRHDTESTGGTTHGENGIEEECEVGYETSDEFQM